MSFRERRRYCVFGCADLGAYMHGFPHPERRSEMFRKWVSIIGNRLVETDPMKIYKNKKVCAHHFTLDQKVASHRLNCSAVPSLHLEGIFSSPSVLVQLEHNYCIQGVQTSDLGVQTSDSRLQTSDPAVHTIDTGSKSIAQQSCIDRLNPPSTSQTAEKEYKSLEYFIKRQKNAQKEIRLLKTQLRKTKKRELNYKSRLSAMDNALSDNSAFKKVTANMTMAAKIFTGMQFRHALKKPKGRRYNIEEKLMALSLYKKSPKGYSLFSKYFKLPSAKCLKILLSEIKLAPGINKSIFEKIKETVVELQEQDRLCTLIFDEMSIEPNVHYESATDQFKGFISHSDGLKIANHALVFMVKGIKKNYKQPVAYYFTQSLKMPELKIIIKEVIKHVHSTGLRILCTVCDQSATNVSTINSLVAETKEDFLKEGKEWRQEIFCIENKQIIPLYDAPHLLKGLRNNLMDKNLKYIDHKDGNKEKIVKWKYFEMLYEADKTCGELRCLHKLTEEHVYKNKIKKMRVKIAAQLFSHSVAVTTDHLTARQILPEECRQLIPMVLMLDKLFDSLNAGTFHIPNGKIYRGAVRRNSPHHQLWQDAIQFLKSVKFIKKKVDGDNVRLIESSAPSVNNFIKTIKGMQTLWNILNKKYSLDTMLTRNFNQDPVENFFGNIRSLGVRNISPNCQAFEGAFKTLLLNNYSCRQSINANCEEDLNECLQSLQFLLKENKKGNNPEIDNHFAISEEMYEIITNVPTGGGDISMTPKRYVCGWVLTKCLKKIVKNCEICRRTLIATNVNSEENSYIRAKEYNLEKQWLCYPSDQLSNSFNEIQEITLKYLKTNFQKNKPKECINFFINTFTQFPFNCERHKQALQNYFIDMSINILIFSWCRNINRILTGKIKNSALDDPVKTSAQIYYNTHKHKIK